MKCLLDLDGVLVDFMDGAHKFHGIPYDYDNNYPYDYGEWDIDEKTNKTAKEFWQPLGGDFWANLNWMVDGKAILELLEEVFSTENIAVLSTPTLHPESLSGKYRWIEKHLPDYKRRFLIGPAKWFCAHPDNVLIDDADHNVFAFRKCGGRAITVPRKWNMLYNYPTLEGIKIQLHSMGLYDG